MGTDRRVTLEELFEFVSGEAQQGEASNCGDIGGARYAGEKGHFAEAVSRVEARHLMLISCLISPRYQHCAGKNDEEGIAVLALTDDPLSGRAFFPVEPGYKAGPVNAVKVTEERDIVEVDLVHRN